MPALSPDRQHNLSPSRVRASPSSARRLLGYLGPHFGKVALATTMATLAAGATSAYAFLVGPLLKATLGGGAPTVPLLGAEGLRWKIPLALVGVAAVKALSQWLQGGLMQGTAQQVMARLRRELYAKLLALPPRFFEERHSGELLAHFTFDVGAVEAAVAQALTSSIKDSLQVLVLLVACASIDVRLFALAFVVLPATLLPVSRFAKSLKKVTTRSLGSLGRLTRQTSEQLQNLKVLQAYRGGQRALEQLDAEQSLYLKEMKRSLFIRAAFTPTLEVLGMVGIALTLAVGARAVGREPELAAKLLSFIVAALLMYQPLKALAGSFSQLVQGSAAAARLFEVADEPLALDAGGSAQPLRHQLRLTDVSVSYGAGGADALRGLTLDIRAGQRTALVGSSGSGKSTVFAALLGFVPLREGSAEWDGAPLSGFDPHSLREQLAWVPQEPVMFSGTLRHNLLLGRPDADEPALWEALRRAHADGFVRELPEGLDQPVGERGSQLSGGQRQRIAIARAFLRQPSVLLLDEPTSALDAASEREVQSGLEDLMKGRTVLVIAHRLATVAHADRICVLEQGKVVEVGTHDELVARGGRYASLLRQGSNALAG